MAKINRSPVLPDETHDVSEEQETVSVTKPVSRTIGSGWGAKRQEFPKFEAAPYLKLWQNGKRVVKIMQDEPELRYFEHYIRSAKNKRYFCPGKDICPLCAVGHPAGIRFMINVVDMEEPDVVRTWSFGTTVAAQLQAFIEEKRTSPLNRLDLYFQVYHVQNPGKDAPDTVVMPVSYNDLSEYWDITPLTAEHISELEEGLHGEDSLWKWTEKKLQEAADNLKPSDFPPPKKKDSE